MRLILSGSIFCQLTSDSLPIQIHVAPCFPSESSYCNRINGFQGCRNDTLQAWPRIVAVLSSISFRRTPVSLDIIQFAVELRVKNTFMPSFQYDWFFCFSCKVRSALFDQTNSTFFLSFNKLSLQLTSLSQPLSSSSPNYQQSVFFLQAFHYSLVLVL